MTFLEMQTYVLDRLSIHTTDTAKVTQVKNALNRVRDRLVAMERLNVTIADLTFTANATTATLPAGVMEILSVRTGTNTLEPVSWNELATYRLSTTPLQTGPLVYMRDGAGTTIQIWPAPTTTATVTASVAYVAQPTELSADGDTPSEIPRAYHDLLCELAIIRVAESEEAPDLANGARRIAYGTPGTSERGLLAEFRAYMSRSQGDGDTRIWVRGF